MTRNECCNAILVVDDLDCRDLTAWRERFAQCIDAVPAYASVDRWIAFAAPELEAWIIADWDNSLARHQDFKERHAHMRHWLSTEKAVPFAAPETFGAYCATRDTCREKLSQAIVEASLTMPGRQYSKGEHTPSLLLEIRPEVVGRKCPLFKELCLFLRRQCVPSSVGCD